MKLFTKYTVILSLSIPLSLLAEDTMRMMELSSAHALNTRAMANAVVNVSCPAGWHKTFDITGSKTNWRENSPVIICKPNNGQVMRCPNGTFFYIKGSEYSNGYRNGEIGCRTGIR